MHVVSYVVLFAAIHTSHSENEDEIKSTEDLEFHGLMKTIFNDTTLDYNAYDNTTTPKVNRTKEDIAKENLQKEHKTVEAVKFANNFIHTLTAIGKLKLGTLILNLKRIIYKNEERNNDVNMKVNKWDDDISPNTNLRNSEGYNNAPVNAELQMQSGVDDRGNIQTDSDVMIESKLKDTNPDMAPKKHEYMDSNMNDVPNSDIRNYNYEPYARGNGKELKLNEEDTLYQVKKRTYNSEDYKQKNQIDEQDVQTNNKWYKKTANDYPVHDNVNENANPMTINDQKDASTYPDTQGRYSHWISNNNYADDSWDDMTKNIDPKLPNNGNINVNARNWKNNDDSYSKNSKVNPKIQENDNWLGRKLKSVTEHETKTDTEYEKVDPNNLDTENKVQKLKNLFEDKMQSLHLRIVKNFVKSADKASLALHMVDKYIELLTAARYAILGVYENYYTVGDEILRRNWSFMQDKVLSDGEEEKSNLIKHLCERNVVCKVYPAFFDHMADFMDMIMYLPDENIELLFKALLSQSQDLDFFIKLFFPDTSKDVTRKVLSLENSVYNSKYVLQVVILFVSNKHKIFSSGNPALDDKVKALRIIMDIIDQAFANEAIEVTFGDLKIGVEKWIGDPTNEKMHQTLRTFLTHMRVILESQLSEVAKYEIKYLSAFIESGEANDLSNNILTNGSRYLKLTPL